ncbi:MULTISPECIES: hypothetical protein [Actinoalloteichus]|uniref:hypothetical protein n=1 Tax=Actinoalloteichus TaxID=65496 RepID=UPI001E2DB5D6|nr:MULTISPECIES: hypothetical protein [Actinoalloteichus]
MITRFRPTHHDAHAFEDLRELIELITRGGHLVGRERLPGPLLEDLALRRRQRRADGDMPWRKMGIVDNSNNNFLERVPFVVTLDRA